VYDLRVEVVEILGFCDQPMCVGDYFELRGGRLYIPEGKYFCIWALQSVLPLLPAKQRESVEVNDWLQHTTRVACPDPNGRVILEIKRMGVDTDAAVTDAAAGRQGGQHTVFATFSDQQLRDLRLGGNSGPVRQRSTPPPRLLVFEKDCTGCRRCELACAFAKTGSYARLESRIRIYKDDVLQVDRPLVCRQCGHARCVASCPEGALTRDPATHAVVLSRELCSRCGRCAEACPFEAVQFAGDGYPLFCDLCQGQPACTGVCPTGAIQYGLAGAREPNVVARAVHGDFGNGGEA